MWFNWALFTTLFYELMLLFIVGFIHSTSWWWIFMIYLFKLLILDVLLLLLGWLINYISFGGCCSCCSLCSFLLLGLIFKLIFYLLLILSILIRVLRVLNLTLNLLLTPTNYFSSLCFWLTLEWWALCLLPNSSLFLNLDLTSLVLLLRAVLYLYLGLYWSFSRRATDFLGFNFDARESFLINSLGIREVIALSLWLNLRTVLSKSWLEFAWVWWEHHDLLWLT